MVIKLGVNENNTDNISNRPLPPIRRDLSPPPVPPRSDINSSNKSSSESQSQENQGDINIIAKKTLTKDSYSLDPKAPIPLKDRMDLGKPAQEKAPLRDIDQIKSVLAPNRQHLAHRYLQMFNHYTKSPDALSLREFSLLIKDAELIAQNPKEIFQVGYLGTHKFVIQHQTRRLDEVPQIIALFRLNKGGFAEVETAYNLTYGTSTALKTARTERKEEGSAQIQQESKILGAINPRGNVRGIQAPPYQIVDLSYQNKTALMTHQYSGSGSGIIAVKAMLFISPENQLVAIRDLTFGLAYIQKIKLEGGPEGKIGLLHGDIKPENILYTIDDSEQCLRLFLSDWGDARTPSKALAHPIGIFTRRYMSLNDYNLLEKGKSMEASELIDLESKRDVFALGLTIAELLCGTKFTNKDLATHEIIIRIEGNILFNDLDIEIREMILRMIDLDFQKRPSPQEIDDFFKTFIQQKYPNAIDA